MARDLDRTSRKLAAIHDDLESRLMPAYGTDGYAQEPAGDHYLHRGPDRLREFYRQWLSNASGVSLEHCALTDGTHACALEYNVVSKEYKVAAVNGETLGPYVTRDLRDAQRVLSEVRALKLTPATSLEATDIFYVRVYAETALRGENTFLTRMSGGAEQTLRQSDHRTIMRVQ